MITSGPRTAHRGHRRASTTVVAAVTGLALLVTAGCGLGSQVAADEVDAGPYESLRIVAPADEGGGWDGTARAMASAFEADGLANSTEVTNVSGAGGTIGLTQLKDERSENFLMVMGLVMVGTVETNRSTATLLDTTPIARLTAEDEVIVVDRNSPFRTIQDLVAALQADTPSVSIAGGSAGGTDHILAALLAQAVGAPVGDLNYQPFSGGGESLAPLVAGEFSAGISGISEYSEQLASGELRALAVSGAARVDGVDAPTLVESGYDVELVNWRGVVAPPGLSDEATVRLTNAVAAMHDSPAWKEQLEINGWEDNYLSGPLFTGYLDDERDRIYEVLAGVGLVA